MDQQQKQAQALRRASVYGCNNDQIGYYSGNMEKEDNQFDCPSKFDIELYQYGKLREKMAIEILVKAVRVSHINVEENDVETLDC